MHRTREDKCQHRGQLKLQQHEVAPQHNGSSSKPLLWSGQDATILGQTVGGRASIARGLDSKLQARPGMMRTLQGAATDGTQHFDITINKLSTGSMDKMDVAVAIEPSRGSNFIIESRRAKHSINIRSCSILMCHTHLIEDKTMQTTNTLQKIRCSTRLAEHDEASYKTKPIIRERIAI